MQRLGNVSDTEMFRTFNMGVGMVIVCSQFDADAIAHEIGHGFDIGVVVAGDKKVTIV
jgi:phosphoribosylformylglycinamidine cyclo-ligase